jgi:hypothetical protein
MKQQLATGARLKSVACSTEVVAVTPPADPVDLRCGGASMVTEGVAGSEPLDPGHAAGTLLGKRYTDDDTVIELLAVKPGEGSLSIDGRSLTLKGVKPLPASD